MASSRPHRFPWSTNITTHPAGLRECVLRVRHLSLAATKQLVSGEDQRSLYRKVARWRVYDRLRYEKLLKVMRLDILATRGEA